MKFIEITIILLYSFVLNISCADQITVEEEDVWENIQECIVSVAIDYESGTTVGGLDEVELVFNRYIIHSIINQQKIFGRGTNWRFDSAEKHGLYKEIKYWNVSASWFSEEDQLWQKKEVFDVSENGEVVRLLGCI